ncbi:haloalkane dehalogenase [Modestobacter sp. VKM Ac-2979]|uniref:haloalkane dehalogenase n=1 Tax=unclassified Modestobacter TaxID=2643866 RepID=UPI0022ABBF4D|nr:MULTISPECIES: haloalkane dehalogenase [unclassified Modestobacter]MCZ2813284.1 haloalkane dehalogenase [Modestobacter sp. VKM Ac-2979]MCZ2842524.1 haloalkane dehalogenase [Modestobacter sp. VKM Ac-2980]
MADDVRTPVPADDPFPRSRVQVGDQEMAFVDVGEGDPIVFLHGNPTSSYLWRNVIPHVRHLGRCLAPDLVGMGESSKLADPGPGSYSFDRHAQFLAEFLSTVGVTERITLVLHDWGSGLGFDWAATHPEAVRGIAFMEAIVTPMIWADWPRAAKPVFQAMRGADGERKVLDQNVFVEKILPAEVRRGLSAEAHDRYRAPFGERADRWPTLEWPRQLPIEHVPPGVHDVVDRYGQWLAHSEVPKLFVNVEPGSILVGRQRDRVRRWPALTEVTVPGGHFVPEDSPDEIGRALAEWIPTLR